MGAKMMAILNNWVPGSEQFTILGGLASCSGSRGSGQAARGHSLTDRRGAETVYLSFNQPTVRGSLGHVGGVRLSQQASKPASPNPSSKPSLRQASPTESTESTQTTPFTRRPQHHQQRPSFFWVEAQLVNPGLAGWQHCSSPFRSLFP
jgi:hypothetical protein